MAAPHLEGPLPRYLQMYYQTRNEFIIGPCFATFLMLQFSNALYNLSQRYAESGKAYERVHHFFQAVGAKTRGR